MNSSKPYTVAISTLKAALIYCVLILCALHAGGVAAQTQMPTCPDQHNAPLPLYSDAGENPNYRIWRNLAGPAINCQGLHTDNATLVVALAGRFHHGGTVEDIASRAGGLSQMQGLRYWSTTDKNWRKLISESTALSTDSTKDTRDDFSSVEVLSGEPLYFAQNDTRTWGMNTYRFNAVTSDENSLTILSENISPIKLGPVTLFVPNAIKSLVIVSRYNENTWSYYSIVAIQAASFATKEKSLINRQSAAFRFLAGLADNKEPPLAR